MFSETIIYIKVEHDFFELLNVQTGNIAKIHGKFSNPRLAIAHFRIAEAALRDGIYEAHPKSIFRIAPIVVLHQIHNSEGGLCEVEERVLRELALGAGARKVFVWQGECLNATQLQDNEFLKTLS